jgi:RluA family pseudouridine synthase
MKEAEIQKRVLYRDGLILVIDKPAGLACHQGPSGGDYIEKYFNFLQYGLPKPPNLAHRLDRDTSGCLVLGRHRKALAKMGKLFEQNLVKKKYWAVCHGRPKEDAGIINAPLLKINTKRGWRIVVEPDLGKGSQESITDYRLIKYDEANDISWIECAPQTGRTHQIRIHLKHIGCPIVGDPFYGHHRKDDEMIDAGAMVDMGGEQLHLHARSVEIPISKNKPAILVEANPPPHMMKRLKILGYQ